MDPQIGLKILENLDNRDLVLPILVWMENSTPPTASPHPSSTGLAVAQPSRLPGGGGGGVPETSSGGDHALGQRR